MPKAVRSFFPAMSLMLIVCLGSAFAHDQPHQRIDEISLELEHNPDHLELYLERGELYRHTARLDLALRDFDRVLLLNPDHKTVNLHSGRLLFEAGQYKQAHIALDEREPGRNERGHERGYEHGPDDNGGRVLQQPQ